MNAGRRRAKPKVVVLAGPNGSGKSTTAPRLLRRALSVDEFVNADVIARGLSGFAPQRVAMAAGRIMMKRIRELASQRASFAFETTLASRSFAGWLHDLKQGGYLVHVLYLWLPSADMAVERVAERVRLGGHDVSEATVRRRYLAGLRNFFELYQPLANKWQVIENSIAGRSRLIASGSGDDPTSSRTSGFGSESSGKPQKVSVVAHKDATNDSARAARIAEAEAVEAAVQEAVLEALLQHKRAGNPVVSWRDGRVVRVMPEDIPVDDTPDGPRWRD